LASFFEKKFFFAATKTESLQKQTNFTLVKQAESGRIQEEKKEFRV
jgi:hypothetical protein